MQALVYNGPRVSHKLPLKGGPDSHEHFDARDAGWTKVVLKPAA
jgi:glutathione-independent formaldehyde dehydrogenase